MLNEAEDLQGQCEAQQHQLMELDQLGQSSGTTIKLGISRDPCSVTSFVGGTEKQIGKVRDSVTARANEIRTMDEKWSQFENERTYLMEWLRSAKNTADHLVASENGLAGVEALLPAVGSLLAEMNLQEANKESLHKSGRYLIELSPSSLSSVQNSMAVADTEWEVLLHTLLELQNQYSDIVTTWRECQEARAPLYAIISSAVEMCESVQDQHPNDLAEAIKLNDQCRKSLDNLRRSRLMLENLTGKTNQLHNKLDKIHQFDSEPLRQEMAALQRDWTDVQTRLNARIQNLDMQQVVFRQLAVLQDEMLNWTSEAKETLVDALSQSAELDLMEMKLNKIRQELPVHTSIQDNICTKITKLYELNNGQRPHSIESLEQLVQKEMDATKTCCSNLESSINSIHQQEDGLHKDFREFSNQIANLKTKVKSCEDLMASDDKIATQFHQVQSITEQHSALQGPIALLQDRCTKLQNQCGSASEAFPLTKELRNAQKMNNNLASQLKKLSSNLYDVVNKRFNDRISNIQRLTTNAQEKLNWCSAEPSADRFSIEAKLNAIHEVETSLEDASSKLLDVKTTARAIASISDAGTQHKINDTLQEAEKNLRILGEDCEDRKQSIDYSNGLLQRFELTSENVSSWLRDVESHIRNETVNQVGLTQLSEKIGFIKELNEDIEAHQDDIKEVKSVADQVMSLMPESHVSHFSNHLNMRYTTALKFVQSCLKKHEALELGYGKYCDVLHRMEDWLKTSSEQLKVHEKDVTAPSHKPSLAYQSKLQALKLFMEQKDEGQSLLNEAVNAGDALVPNITAEDKASIRAALRNLRDNWETHLDQVNSLYKKVEGIILQLSSFDDSCRQIRRWIEETRLRLTTPTQIGQSIQEIKAELQTWRILAQDVQSHQSLVNRLRERLQEISNPDAITTVDDIASSYNLLLADSKECVLIMEKHVADYDAFIYSTETFRDWLTGLQADLMLTEEGVTDKAAAESKLRVISELLQQKQEGEGMLKRCQCCMDQICGSNSLISKEMLKAELDVQQHNWTVFLAACQQRHDGLVELCSRWSAFEETARSLASWLRQAENCIQDQSLKATVAAKEAHLDKLMSAQVDVNDKDKQFQAILEVSQKIEGESSLQIQVPQMVSRYQSLMVATREMISRYQMYVKEHQDFSVNYATLTDKIDSLASELNSCREIVGDYKVLQERRAKLEKLNDLRTELDKQVDALADLGEKLYVHTAPDGREMLRVQLKSLRERWEALYDDLGSAAIKLDQCLQQFSDFSASQEQLTRWLRDVEQSMLQHSDLKSTLQEKRAQQQSHKIVHQEILGHKSLVESVCVKAQQLIEETQDKSLNAYITSIKQLFSNIVTKSEELMGRLDSCVKEHTQLNNSIKAFQDWITFFRDETQALSDTSGEKSETKKKLHLFEDIHEKRVQGLVQLDEIQQLCSVVVCSTSARGCQLVHKTISNLQEELEAVTSNLQELKKNLESIMQRWQSFENGLEICNAWFRQQEAAFGDQQLHVTLEDKEAQLSIFLAVRDAITGYESEIDSFVDQATALFQSSGVERLRPLISQISSKYQQLHVQSMEVVSKHHGIVDDHKLYEEKFFETLNWITLLEDKLDSVLKSRDQSDTSSSCKVDIQNLIAEKEQASHRLGSLSSAGERLFPETASQGREKIRYDIKTLRLRWEELEQRLNEQHKSQEQQLQRLSSYQDGIIQIGVWLDMMEKSVSNDQGQQAASLPEIRSQLLKHKTHLQDVLSHKRQIETLKERARSLVGDAPQSKENQEIQRTINDISQRYDLLCGGLQGSILHSEWLLDVLQQHHDLEKAHTDWQQQSWLQLNSNTGNCNHFFQLLYVSIRIKNEFSYHFILSITIELF